MSEAEGAPQRSVRRWWEIPSGRKPQEGRYSELLTGGHSRHRPERSLAVGIDTTEAPRSWWHRYMWPIIGSVVAFAIFVVLIVLAIVL